MLIPGTALQLQLLLVHPLLVHPLLVPVQVTLTLTLTLTRRIRTRPVPSADRPSQALRSQSVGSAWRTHFVREHTALPVKMAAKWEVGRLEGGVASLRRQSCSSIATGGSFVTFWRFCGLDRKLCRVIPSCSASCTLSQRTSGCSH